MVGEEKRREKESREQESRRRTKRDKKTGQEEVDGLNLRGEGLKLNGSLEPIDVTVQNGVEESWTTRVTSRCTFDSKT